MIPRQDRRQGAAAMHLHVDDDQAGLLLAELELIIEKPPRKGRYSGRR